MPDPILKTSATHAAAHFERAGTALASRQIAAGPTRGNVPPWSGAEDLDFHGTLAAIWIWARHQALTGDSRFSTARDVAWTFVEGVWRRFIPETIGPEVDDESAYDCALALRAFRAECAVGQETDEPAGAGVAGGRDLRGPSEAKRVADQGQRGRAALVHGAARVLAAHLSDLEDLSGRDFQDPGFLAWNLIEYARFADDRGLVAVAQRFVERAFGMKAPPSFASEPDFGAGLFDFSSTTATRVLAIIASEGSTPFVGAWLRERVAGAIPSGFVPRALDENCWNACVAALTGRAYVVSTDPRFLDAYLAVSAELERREVAGDGILGPAIARPQRDGSRNDPSIVSVGTGVGQGSVAGMGPQPHTLATFYGALAADALVRTDQPPLAAPPIERADAPVVSRS